MSDNIATDTKLNRLPPMERLRDGKRRMNRQGPDPRKKEEKGERISALDADFEEKEASPESSGERSSGKIVDIVI